MATLAALKTRFSDQADAAEALAELAAFGSIAVTGAAIGGGVVTLPLVIASSAKAAGAVFKLIKVLIPEKSKQQFAFDNAERIDQIFYLFAQRSYLHSLKLLTNKLPDDSTVDPNRHRKLVEDIETSVVQPDRAEASFEFGWNPDSGPLQLFSSYTRWLHPLLVSMGADERHSFEWLKNVESAARKNLFKELVSQKKDHQWLVEYQLLRDSAQIIDLLRDFTDPQAAPGDPAWKKYMADLARRPSNPIWGEEEHRLSIEELFVEPDFEYSRQRYACTVSLKPTAPLLAFMSGLLSQRRPSTELVFLMGGPGSGKTTTIEILCSELAKAAWTPVVLVQAKRLNRGKCLMSEVQTYLSSIGCRAVADMLPSAQDCVLAIDGFDELAYATLSTLEDFFREAHDLVREHIGSRLRIVLCGRSTLFSANDVCIPPGSHIVTLKPFGKERVTEWSKRWRAAKGGDFDGMVYIESKSTEIQELAAQPMLLYLMAKMHEEKEPIPTYFGAQGGTKFLVYEKIMDWVCRRQRDKGASDVSNQHLRRFLQVAGLTTHQGGQRVLHWKSFAASLQTSGLIEDPNRIDSRVYGIILSFAFNKIEERAWEFTHKSFGEALAAESIGRVLVDISETGRDGERWRLPLRSATGLWVQTFGPNFLTWDILEFCSGWIETKGFQFIGPLLSRLVEVFRCLMGVDISHEIIEVSRNWERAVLDVLGNAMRSWFSLTNAAIDCLSPKDAEALIGDMAGTVSFSDFRRGAYVANIVSPIKAGESELLFKHISKLVDGIQDKASDGYVMDLIRLYQRHWERSYSEEKKSVQTEPRRLVDKWMRYFKGRDEILVMGEENPLETAIKGLEEILHHVLNLNVNKILQTRLAAKQVPFEELEQYVFSVLEEMIVEVGPPDDRGILVGVGWMRRILRKIYFGIEDFDHE